MPTTYNGIGTHYYGKKHVETRRGNCPHCGAHVDLTSYDTRLWFVVVFIPIIPLGRKRIVDQCPSCSRHFAVDADKWEASKQLAVSGAQDKFRTNPTPEAGLEVHGQMLQYHEFVQAAEFRLTLLEKFSDNANVHAQLGAALVHFSKHDEAAPFFARALELRPDLPEARIGVAEGHLRAGKLDDARKLLDFLEKPGASQLYSLGPLEILAGAFQKAGRHEEAMALFERLIAELPTVTEHKGFRKLVAKSEKALARKTSVLPKLKFSWRRLFQSSGGGGGGRAVGARTFLMLGAVVALIVLGLAIGNEYIRRHRMVHLVNQLPQPATVRIDGVEAAKDFKGVRTFALTEGRHHAVVSGAAREEFDFDVKADYFDRWSADPMWVINVGGAAILIRTQAVYRQNPPPPSISVHFGRSFESFGLVTHPFQDMPETIRLKSNEERTLAELQIFKGNRLSLFNFLLQEGQEGQALDYAERTLRAQPDDAELLRMYSALARRNAAARLDAFLREGLKARPVRIEWHRAYQNQRQQPALQVALIAEYDQLLAAEPGNSALLYLRGRLGTDRAAARDYFERAMRADATSPFPLFALGYDRIMSGDWNGAKPLFAQAAKLRPNDISFSRLLFISRLASGEAAALETETRQQLARDQVNRTAVIHLVDALAAENRRDDALKAATDYARAANAKYGSTNAADGNKAVQRYALYAVGDLAALEKHIGQEKDPDSRALRAEAILEQGRVDEAVKLAAVPEDSGERISFQLALGIAYRQAGNTAEADRWTAEAGKLLAAGSEGGAIAAAMLASPTAPTMAAAQDLSLQPELKAVLLASLAVRHPTARAALAPLARQLNVQRSFPYYLVQRVTAEAK